ncbi:MAG TPA: hypothetical protein VMC84_06945 [Methanocella sp.]|uniref:hypothetical protein n=1 Tax=Methanocella sp. TaxID=2052833 RepID=UPI002B896552|nr:hypothetical protein [Methanocella sp.]HTY90899.1 hypothetical protein [Methanocella sp.]
MKKLVSIALIAAMLMACIGMAAAQQGMTQAQNLPPAPPKATPDMQYGNTARAAIIGERLSNAAEGNANVHIDEGSVITVSIYLLKDAGTNDLAGTMANLTYMIADLYGTMADKTNSKIVLNVYDTSKNMIIDAKFNMAKNDFEYFDVAQDAATEQQPAAGMQQTGKQQPAMGRMG